MPVCEQSITITAGARLASNRCMDSNVSAPANLIIRGRALVQNLRRGYYELGV